MDWKISKEMEDYYNSPDKLDPTEYMLKYYQPDITEFHVGFEYYMPLLKEDKDGNIYQDDYVKHIWHESDNMWEYFNASFDGNNKKTITVPNVCRVKHLDREDIESFEFKQSNLHKNIFLKQCDEYNHRPAECVGINYNEGFDHVMIFFVEKGSKTKYGQTIFAGKIKNKSELKRLLKQLGV